MPAVQRLHRFLADEILQQIEQRIARIDIQGAAMLLVEIGADKAVFGSAERLASWVGICPGNNESAGSARAGASAEATPGCAGCCASSRKPLPERAAR